MRQSRDDVKSKQVLPPTYLLVALLVMVALHLGLPVVTIIPAFWNLIGIIPVICGVALNLSADRAFKRAGTTVKPFQESTALVTTGAYGISRHPMYLGYVLILLGVGVLLRSVTPFFVIPVFAVLMEVVFIAVEERMLEDTFGKRWTAYKSVVRRWI
jgi:protein-S-isoprenylcysteine O-methyltransferase Ste14